MLYQNAEGADLQGEGRFQSQQRLRKCQRGGGLCWQERWAGVEEERRKKRLPPGRGRGRNARMAGIRQQRWTRKRTFTAAGAPRSSVALTPLRTLTQQHHFPVCLEGNSAFFFFFRGRQLKKGPRQRSASGNHLKSVFVSRALNRRDGSSWLGGVVLSLGGRPAALNGINWVVSGHGENRGAKWLLICASKGSPLSIPDPSSFPSIQGNRKQLPFSPFLNTAVSSGKRNVPSPK